MQFAVTTDGNGLLEWFRCWPGRSKERGEVKADTGSPIRLIAWLRARKEIISLSIHLSVFRIDRVISSKKYEACIGRNELSHRSSLFPRRFAAETRHVGISFLLVQLAT